MRNGESSEKASENTANKENQVCTYACTHVHIHVYTTSYELTIMHVLSFVHISSATLQQEGGTAAAVTTSKDSRKNRAEVVISVAEDTEEYEKQVALLEEENKKPKPKKKTIRKIMKAAYAGKDAFCSCTHCEHSEIYNGTVTLMLLMHTYTQGAENGYWKTLHL